MTDSQNRLFDEFARLFTDAASVAQGVRREATTVLRSQAERFVTEMDLVTREEFDAVKEMASKARAENEALAARLAALEEKLEAAGETKSRRRKPAAAEASNEATEGTVPPLPSGLVEG